jgi:tRNA 2-thiouridine synthesizing protein E
MPIVVNGQIIETDEEGFLAVLKDWNEDVAKGLAHADNCELTPDHWEVIHFLRAYYEDYQVSPAARVLAKAIGKKLGADKGTVTYLLELFPEGASQQMCKYAGLPKPGCSGE